jgi:hypothetical protein
MGSSAPSRPRDMIDALLSEHPPASERQSGIPPVQDRGPAKSLDDLAADLNLALRPPVKVSPSVSRRRALNATALRRYHAMVDHVRSVHGWSWRKIAREAACTVEFVQATYRGERNVPGWLLDAFPPDAQAEAVRVHIEQLRSVK